MKTAFLTLTFFALAALAQGQNNITVTEEAKQEFAGLFFRIGNPQDKTMVEQLHMVNEIFFSVFSPNANKYFNPLLLGKSKNEGTANVFAYADSLNAWFIQNKLYDSSVEAMERLNDILPAMTDSFCACLNSRLKYKDSIPPGTDLNPFADCYKAYTSHYNLALKLSLAFAGYTAQQGLNASRVASTYAMMHCKPTYVFIKNNLVQTAAQQLLGATQYYIGELPETIKKLYAANKTDSLVKYFPAYRQYAAQITALGRETRTWQLSDTATHADTLIFTGTYASGTYGKQHITSQVKLYLSNDVAPIVYRLTYNGRTKILNVAALEKDLNKQDMVLPPPPPPKERKQ